MNKVLKAIGLLNSMVNSGETHSDQSLRVVQDARDEMCLIESALIAARDFHRVYLQSTSVDNIELQGASTDLYDALSAMEGKQ